MSDKSKNHFLNFLKGLGCIFIVFVHVRFPGQSGKIISAIASFAVPVFAMISGYYAVGCDEKTIKRRLNKSAGFLAYAFLLFFAYEALYEASRGHFGDWIKTILSIKFIIKAVVFCSLDFAGVLWYMIALAETYVFWLLMMKWGREKAVIRFFPLLFILRAVIYFAYVTLKLPWYMHINFASEMLGWFLFGAYIRTMPREKVDAFKTEGLLLLSFMGMLLVVLCAVFKWNLVISVLGDTLFSTTLFVIAIKYSDKHVCRWLEFTGEKLSAYVYIHHLLIADILSFAGTRLLNIDGGIRAILHPVITLVVTIIFSFGIFSLFRNNKRL